MINVMIVDDQQPTRMGFSLMVMKDPALRMTLQAGNGQDALDIPCGTAITWAEPP
ncbi:hypothetical protein [Bifidobacterium breve]|uniref:hypothetical protein n=1 Tax=Bifidobacterium breve TaxID=1685 RepID=UPI0020742646|nr:hypothetical protein [Bifidobacterium breve]